ncbi:MAG: PKD domain-containing protein [Bacteroidetes bacterium]|nr:PKD domain-containing protein [Bacteroidota bacterium]
MDTLLFSSYFGGTKSSAEHVDGGTSRFDKRGVIYQSVCGGCGGFSDFPTTAGAWSRTNKGKRPQNTSVGGCNNLLFKVNLDIPDLIARFTMPPHICATYTVNFTNQSVRAKGHKWFFGDGDTSTAINPTHVYKTKGIYTVTLVVTNLLSCSVTDTFKQNILVYLKAKADFKYKMDTCSHIVTFNSSSALATKYFWHFGNGDTSSIQNPIYKYLDSGKYNVTLYADANTTCADTIVKLIKIKRDNFDFKIDTCNNTVSITKISVSDSDFVWYFDSFQTFNVYPSYQFATTGKHTIKLIPRWQKPCDSIIKIINIPKRTKPKPIYSVDTCSGQFIVSNINFPDSNVAWIIDAKDTVKTVLLKKILPIGKHKFTLVTYYQSGCDDTTSFFVNIPPIIKPDFTYTNDTCNRTYKFKADFHLNTTYHWNLGDGNADSGQIAKPHSYAVDSTYAITLTTNKGKVCEQSITKIIKTPTPPKAHFTFVIDSCTGIVQFINTSSRTIKSSNWNFGDGAIATSKNPNHKYAKEGVFKVLLLTSKGTGCEDTASALITTNGLVDELKYYNVITPDGNGENEFFRVWGIKEKCGDYTLEIFNRWGQHVYEKTGRNLEWHGRTQVGIPVPAGTYYWIISGKHIEQIEGSVTVVR